MPTYIRPQRVTVIEGGHGFPLERAAGLGAAVAVALFVLAHWLFLAVGLGAVAVVTLAAVAFLRRYMVVQAAPRLSRTALPVQQPARAIPASRPRAIEAPRTVANQSPDVNRARVPRVR